MYYKYIDTYTKSGNTFRNKKIFFCAFDKLLLVLLSLSTSADVVDPNRCIIIYNFAYLTSYRSLLKLIKKKTKKNILQ